MVTMMIIMFAATYIAAVRGRWIVDDSLSAVTSRSSHGQRVLSCHSVRYHDHDMAERRIFLTLLVFSVPTGTYLKILVCSFLAG